VSPAYASAGTWQSRCDLCLTEQRGPRAFSSRRDLCKSCAMRQCWPRRVLLGRWSLRRWREAAGVSIHDFADACCWSYGRQASVERQVRVNPKTAKIIAESLLWFSTQGADISPVLREWPLFVLLASRVVVDDVLRGVDELRLLGDDEQQEHVREERRADPDGPDR